MMVPFVVRAEGTARPSSLSDLNVSAPRPSQILSDGLNKVGQHGCASSLSKCAGQVISIPSEGGGACLSHACYVPVDGYIAGNDNGFRIL
jgi:hypothetical protein